MIRSTGWTSFLAAGPTWLVGLGLLLAFAGGAQAEDVWKADEPSQGRFEDPEEHGRSAATLEERTREPGSLEGREASARKPGASIEPGDPDDAPAAAGRPEDRVVSPSRLGELQKERRGAGALDFPRPDPATWTPTRDPELQRLRAAYRAASERAEAAIARYDEMRDENHPRGEARLEIVRERNAAIEALREATAALQRAD